MTAEEEWHEGNEKYLHAALAWLRLRLERLAGADGVNRTPPLPQISVENSFLKGLRNRPVQVSAASSPETSTPDLVSEAFLVMEKAAAIDPPPPLIMLGHLFSLSRFEQDLLLLCVSMELDTRIPALCAKAQDSQDRTFPTFALAFALFDEPRWDALSLDRPLRHWHLVEAHHIAAVPFTACPLQADERIVNYAKGLNILDRRLSSILFPSSGSNDPNVLPSSQLAMVEKIREIFFLPNGKGRVPVIELSGTSSDCKEMIARCAANSMGRQLFRLPAIAIPSNVEEMAELAWLYERESMLLPISIILERGENESQTMATDRFLSMSNGITFLDVRDRDKASFQYPSRTVEIARPTPAEQEAAWCDASPHITNEFAKLLAGQFSVDVPSIIRTAGSIPYGSTQEEAERAIWNTCVSGNRPNLDLLAQRIAPKAMMDDLVLPRRESTLLQQIAAQVKNRTTVYDDWGFRKKMNRGLGISALFAGESGTGKTMAAEAIANELFLDLYRIDLSQVVNKYIGETEKNLRRLFDAAEDGGAILFFDEADALFGKRSEVKDSHDRYANIEINYLLQRIEAYQGLAILATNAKSALDPAFVRRLRFIIDFPYPGPVERKAIWEKAFPKDVPCEKLDTGRLARFNLTGGSIHNIALNSAFLAADSKDKVTMRTVLDAVRTELTKMNKPLNEAEFR